MNPRDLAGILTTPLKRRADSLGLPRPWTEDRIRGRSSWRQHDPDTARRILGALEQASNKHRSQDLLAEEIAEHPEAQRPMPSAVFVWSPVSLQRLTPQKRDSSCLRDSRPGSRAVIYRAHDNQGIVALFDVNGYPRPHEKWRWSVEGAFHGLERPISRDELLDNESLRPVFANIMGRRRLPPTAQRALSQLLEARFPDHQLPIFKALQQLGGAEKVDAR